MRPYLNNSKSTRDTKDCKACFTKLRLWQRELLQMRVVNVYISRKEGLILKHEQCKYTGFAELRRS